MPTESQNLAPDVEFLSLIIEKLLKHPEDLAITRRIDERGLHLEIACHDEDRPVLIGRGGRTIKAIREVLRVFGYVIKARISISILDAPVDVGVDG